MISTFLKIARKTRMDLNISFCIICYDKDVHFLPRILQELQKQTVSPDEIVVLASGIKDKKQLNDMRLDICSSVKIHTLEDRALPNKARNAVASLAEGDVICLSDVDDIPHPQKIELVKKYFKMKT